MGSSNESGGRGESAVAIVESEKTAVIMSERYPDYLWLAAGGLNELTPEKLFLLVGRKVILFPDTDTDCTAFSLWYNTAQKAQRLLGQNIYVSPLLEQRATPDQKRRKIDIADYVIENEKAAIKPEQNGACSNYAKRERLRVGA